MGRHEHSSSRQTVSSTAALPGSGTRRSGATVRLSPAQLEHVVQAIQEGKVDALFVPGAESDWLFTLSGADRAYRLLIEDMSEGALTLVPDGIVAYANRHFAVVLEVPLQRIIGSRIHACFAQEGHEVLARLLRAGQRGKSSVELELLTARGSRVPVLVSVSPMADDEMPGALCMVVTDLTIQKRNEAALQLQAIREALRAVRPFHGELLNYRKDGTPFWNELSITPVFDDH